MATAAEKKQRELLVVRHLLSCSENEGEIVEEGEAPDFIVDLSGRRVGVEVTMYVRGQSRDGSAPRELHAFLKAVLDEAKRLFGSNSDEALWVTVDPREGRATAPKRELAALLCGAVQDCLAGGDIPQRPLAIGPLRVMLSGPAPLECAVPEALTPVISGISLVRLPPGSVSSWRIRQSGDTKAEVKELQDLLASKEPLIATYQNRVPEAWLAIDAYGSDVLQAITVTTDIVSHTYSTGFARVFLVDTTTTAVWELRTSQGPAAQP